MTRAASAPHAYTKKYSEKRRKRIEKYGFNTPKDPDYEPVKRTYCKYLDSMPTYRKKYMSIPESIRERRRKIAEEAIRLNKEAKERQDIDEGTDCEEGLEMARRCAARGLRFISWDVKRRLDRIFGNKWRTKPIA